MRQIAHHRPREFAQAIIQGLPNSGDNMSTHQSKPTESGHASVNGIQMYYELHGRNGGVPLVLLHGGGSTIELTRLISGHAC